MKVLYVSTVSSTINAFLVPHIEMLKKMGATVDVAANINRSFNQKIIDLGCRTYELSFSRSPLRNNYFKLIQEVKNIIIKEKYDIVHTHTPIASAVVRLACRDIKNVKVLYTVHGFHFYNGAPAVNWIIYYPIERYLANFTETIITINEEDYRRAKKFNAKSVEYVPGVGLDLTEVKKYYVDSNNLRKSLGFIEDDIILMSVGELNSNKNHRIVLKSLAVLNIKKIKYIVCGEGTLLKELESYANDLGISEQVYFLGFRDDIYELLDIADIYVFPSFREGLSKSVMEAMAKGKPIIASDIRGNRDLVDNGKGGFLFNPKNAKQLNTSILRLIKNKKMMCSMGEYNMKKIKQYSLDTVLKKLKRIYRNVIEQE